MTDDNALARMIGLSLGRQARAVHDRVPDLNVLETPSGLLRMMLYELGTEAGWAIVAGNRALEAAESKDHQLFWREIQILLSLAGSASRFIWPDTQRKRQRALFPRRGADIQLLMDVTDDNFVALRDLRNDVIHMDERFETQWTNNPGKGANRLMGGKTSDGSNFLSWTPETKTLTFLEHDISLPEVIADLDAIQRRSGEAFSLMLLVTEVDDETVDD